MRRILFWVLVFLVFVTAMIAVVATILGKPELMLFMGIPGALFISVLFVYLICVAYSAAKDRHDGMEDVATKYGLNYSRDASSLLRTEVDAFDLLTGRTRLSDEIRGQYEGVPVVVFICLNMHEESATYRAVALLPQQVGGVPEFLLTPNSILDQLRPKKGDHVRLEGSQQREAFSRQFGLRSTGTSTEQELRALFSDRLLEFVMTMGGVNIEVANASLIVWPQNSAASEIANGFRSVRENTATEAETVLQRALAIRAELMK